MVLLKWRQPLWVGPKIVLIKRGQSSRECSSFEHRGRYFSRIENANRIGWPRPRYFTEFGKTFLRLKNTYMGLDVSWVLLLMLTSPEGLCWNGVAVVEILKLDYFLMQTSFSMAEGKDKDRFHEIIQRSVALRLKLLICLKPDYFIPKA